MGQRGGPVQKRFVNTGHARCVQHPGCPPVAHCSSRSGCGGCESIDGGETGSPRPVSRPDPDRLDEETPLAIDDAAHRGNFGAPRSRIARNWAVSVPGRIRGGSHGGPDPGPGGRLLPDHVPSEPCRGAMSSVRMGLSRPGQAW